MVLVVILVRVFAMWQQNLPSIVSRGGPRAVAKVTQSLSENPNMISVPDEFGFTGLHLAAWESTPAMVRVLVVAKADINQVDPYGRTALTLAAWSGQWRNVRLLVSSGADVTYAGVFDGYTALHFVARNIDDTATVSLLVQQKANINQATPDGSTPLILAAKHQNWRNAKQLVNMGAIVDCVAHGRKSALHWAARHGDENMSWYLLHEYARTKNPTRALHFAVWTFDKPEMVSRLVRKINAKIDQPNRSGSTALILAAMYKRWKTAKRLVNLGAEVNYATPRGYTALHIAATTNNPDIVSFLVEKKADIDQVNHDGKTPLIFAIRGRQWPNVQQLVSLGAEVNYATPRGYTALHVAATTNNPDIVSFLVENKADMDHVNHVGITPLILAVRGRQWPNVKQLVNLGADVTCTTVTTRYTALHFVARDIDNPAMVSLLVQQKANINQVTPDGSTPLILAAKHQKWGNAEQLVNLGAEVNHATWAGNTALLYAVRFEHFRAAKMLLEAKANVNCVATYDSQATPLLLASVKGDWPIMHLLMDYDADVDAESFSHNTALTMTLFHRGGKQKVAVLKKLITRGADLNVDKLGGPHALFELAVRSGIPREIDEVVGTLVEGGAKLFPLMIPDSERLKKLQFKEARAWNDRLKALTEIVRELVPQKAKTTALPFFLSTVILEYARHRFPSTQHWQQLLSGVV